MGAANRFPVSANSRAIGYSKQTDEKKPMIYMGFYQFLAEEAGLSNNPLLSNKINDLHSWVVKLVAKFDTRFATR